ncbi:MAG: hypothetical protein R3194_00820 [Limnobacter sp.]|nr:hypothetical protein [Limnobacter sp.]
MNGVVGNSADYPKAFWCSNLHELLLARAYLASTPWPKQAAAPVLFAPAEAESLFEMDVLKPEVHSLPIDLGFQYEGWLVRRRRKAWLKGLAEGYGLSSVVVWSAQVDSLMRLLESVDVTRQDWSDFELETVDSVPTLQAGPKALSRSTHFYRKVSPHALKIVCVLDCGQVSEGQEASLFADLQMQMAEQEQLAQRLHTTLVVTYLALQPQSALQKRQLKELQPYMQFEGIAGLIGHIAYSDRVISNSRAVTLLCHQMRRDSPVLL